LSTHIEGAACEVRFVVMTIVEFDDIWLNDQLEQLCEYISTKVAPKGLHNPEKL
jgi:hypothetical protein